MSLSQRAAFVAVLSSLIIAVACDAAAASKKPASELLALRDAYAAAFISGDAQAAAKLTYFPMDNAVWQDKPTVGKAGFLKAFVKDPDTAGCFKTEAFESEHKKGVTGINTWDINCNGNVYHFGQRKGQWYLTGYENINE